MQISFSQSALSLMAIALFVGNIVEAGVIPCEEGSTLQHCAYQKYQPEFSQSYEKSQDNIAEVSDLGPLSQRPGLGVKRLTIPKSEKAETNLSKRFFLFRKKKKEPVYTTDDESDDDCTDGEEEEDDDDDKEEGGDSLDEDLELPQFTPSDNFGFDFGVDLDFSVEDPKVMKKYFEKGKNKAKSSDAKKYEYFDLLDDVAEMDHQDNYDEIEAEAVPRLVEENKKKEQQYGERTVRVKGSRKNKVQKVTGNVTPYSQMNKRRSVGSDADEDYIPRKSRFTQFEFERKQPKVQLDSEAELVGNAEGIESQRVLHTRQPRPRFIVANHFKVKNMRNNAVQDKVFIGKTDDIADDNAEDGEEFDNEEDGEPDTSDSNNQSDGAPTRISVTRPPNVLPERGPNWLPKDKVEKLQPGNVTGNRQAVADPSPFFGVSSNSKSIAPSTMSLIVPLIAFSLF